MGIAETLTYDYSFASLLKESDEKSELFLANYSETPESNLPCFFRGKITSQW
jgi:hypothetical protein